jgi:hypothetical protein
MHFAYEGFTQDGDRRCFLFRGIEESIAKIVFSIEIDLHLLVQNRVPVQEGPMFCLQLLTTASVGGPDCLDRFHSYRVVGDDFRPLLVERERRAAEKALKKTSYRKPVRKPSLGSNLHLGTSSGITNDMSFSEGGARSFTGISVRKNAPESSGVYGLSNGRQWLFIGEANNIQARLLEHLEETGTLLSNERPTGFTFEECPPRDRVLRQNALVRQFEPFCNHSIDSGQQPSHGRAD